jgi:hypothetical protein
VGARIAGRTMGAWIGFLSRFYERWQIETVLGRYMFYGQMECDRGDRHGMLTEGRL